MLDAIIYVTGLALFGSAWILVGAWAWKTVIRDLSLRLPRFTPAPRIRLMQREQPALSAAR